jgi:hypothetical protein
LDSRCFVLWGAVGELFRIGLVFPIYVVVRVMVAPMIVMVAPIIVDGIFGGRRLLICVWGDIVFVFAEEVVWRCEFFSTK